MRIFLKKEKSLLVLVDSSIWIDHLRSKNSKLVILLEEEQVVTHPFIIGELACGTLKNRNPFLEHLSLLPSVEVKSNESVLHKVENLNLYSKEIGWIDAHLLCSALESKCKIWTRDKKLHQLSKELHIAL